MATPRECVCCTEIHEMMAKMQQDNVTEQCIVFHPGFSDVCLSIWTLQAAYFNYRQHYGTGDLPSTIEEKYINIYTVFIILM